MARKRRRVDSSTVQPDDPDEQDESDATLPEPHATRKKPATFERFFELPTEVRDMVYEYVYHVPEEERMTNVVVRDEWEYREKIRQQRSAIPLPSKQFPESALSFLLVNKQYLSEASRVFVKCRTFCFAQTLHLKFALTKGCTINSAAMSLARSVQLETDTDYALDYLTLLPGLSVLAVYVHSRALDLGAEKFAWRDEYTDLDLVRLPLGAELLKLRSLKCVTLTRADSPFREPPERQQKIRRLVSKLETLLSDVVTQVRVPQGVANNAPSIHDLLACKSISSSRLVQTPSTNPPDSSKTLTVSELPRTEAQFARMFFLQPHALFKWIQDAAYQLYGLS